MGWRENLLKLERRIAERVEGAFGSGAARTALEIRHQILDEIDGRVQGLGGKPLPFDRLAVHLHPSDQAAAEILRSAFLDDRTLETDVRRLLAESGARLSESLEVVVDLDEAGAASGAAGASRAFSIDLARAERVAAAAAAPAKRPLPEAELVVVKGTAEQAVLRLTRRRVFIGRLRELVDKDGQMLRRNDLVFLDDGEEINSTVGRAHATLYFDDELGEFRIVDDQSRYGTKIFRESRSIEVPPGNRRGVRLLPGDEIYLGRACVRFDLSPAGGANQ